jgi:4-hydroxy-tetrahydrodipicolinate reductase
MIEVVISGAAGRMGQATGRAMTRSEDMRVVGALGAPDRPYTGRDFGAFIGADPSGVLIEQDIEAVLRPGVTWVEFSNPEATMAHVRRIAEAGIPTLIGTTGLSSEHKEELTALSRRMPCLVAPNTSPGANLLLTLAGIVARALNQDFDIEIIEAHHRMKRDAPSGTAQRLAEHVAEARRQTLDAVARYGRSPATGRREQGEIGVHAIRAGDIVGEHTVMFAGPGERLELTHRVRSVDTFAHGALEAVRFLQGRPAGMYTMEQALMDFDHQNR